MPEDAGGWELAYQRGHTRSRKPHEETEALVALFRKHGVKRILDSTPTAPKLARGFLATEGHEAGVPHYFATEAEWVTAFASFEIVDVHTDKQDKTVILARKS